MTTSTSATRGILKAHVPHTFKAYQHVDRICRMSATAMITFSAVNTPPLMSNDPIFRARTFVMSDMIETADDTHDCVVNGREYNPHGTFDAGFFEM